MIDDLNKPFDIEKINLRGKNFSSFIKSVANARKLLECLQVKYFHANNDLASFSARDVRKTTINKIFWLTHNAKFQYMILGDNILKNSFWENVYPKDEVNEDDVGGLMMECYQVYKISYVVLSFSSFEHYLRTIWEKLWPEEYNKCPKSIIAVCSVFLPSKYASMDGDYFNLIKLLANQRNLMHNTGVYVATNKKYPHDEILYKGETYCYDHGKVAKHAGWENIVNWYDDLLGYMLEMNKHSTLRDIDFIEDISAPKDEN